MVTSIAPKSSHLANSELLWDALLVVFLALFAATVLNHLIFTWDIVGYVGAAISWSHDDLGVVHTQTYEALKTGLSEPIFQSLTAGPYGAAMATSPVEFYGQLSMYSVKPLYIGLLQLFHALGLSYVDTGVLLSVLPATLLCALTYCWLKRYVPAQYALAITILLSLCSRLFDIARVVLPDSLSALVLVAAIYLLLERKQALRWGLVLLVASIFIRTNNILFVCPVLIYLGFVDYQTHGMRSSRMRLFAIAFAASVIVYLGISTYFGHSWWRLFYHTFVESIVDIDAFSVEFSLASYLAVLKARLVPLIVGNFVFMSLLLPFLLLSMFALLANRGKPSQLRAIVLIAYLNFIFYCFMFPLVESWDRFFIPFYIFIAVLAARGVAARASDR